MDRLLDLTLNLGVIEVSFSSGGTGCQAIPSCRNLFSILMGDTDLRTRGYILLLLQLVNFDFTAIGSQFILKNKNSL